MNLLTQDAQPAIPGYREIPLTKGQVAIVDAADYEALIGYKWHALWSKFNHTFYAQRATSRRLGQRRLIYMHRQIMGEPSDMEIDHQDRNGLHNWKGNLRLATHAQNLWNKKVQANNKTGIKGIWFWKARNKWQAQIKTNGKRLTIGYYDTPEEAGAAYAEAAKRLHGEFARW